MSKRRRIILFAIIIVVVAGAAAGTALFLSWQHSSTNQPSSNNNTPTTPVKQPAEQKSDAADKLAADGNLKGGVKAYDEAIKNTKDPHEQFTYYSNKATLLYNNHDLAGALTAAQAAYNLEKMPDSAAFVGQIAREQGNASLALEYYKKALGLIDNSDPFAKQDKTYYQGIINDLQGGN